MLYKVKIKHTSECIGDITANTLFGAFLTAYSSLFPVDQALVEDITLSDLFDVDILPAGVRNNKTIYSSFKRVDKSHICRTLIARNAEDDNVPNIATGWFRKESEFYIATELLSLEDLKKILNMMSLFGIGKWRAVGKGRFEVESIDEVQAPASCQKFVALSSFVPDEAELSDITECGYTVRDTIATNGKKQKTQALLIAGTTFNKAKEFAGHHVYDKASGTYIHGRTIVLGA